MRKSTNNSFATILSSLVIIMLVVVVVGFLFIRTDGLTTSYKQFYLKCDNTEILGDYGNFSLSVNKDYTFNIVSSKNITTKQDFNYTIKVIPFTTDNTDFSFIVNGKSKQYSEIDDLTSCFNIRTETNSFTIRVDSDLPDLLKDKYSTENLTNCPTIINTYIPYFRLTITNNDNYDAININFNLISE